MLRVDVKEKVANILGTDVARDTSAPNACNGNGMVIKCFS